MAIRMITSDFISLELINRIIKDSVKKIRKMQWFHFEKNSPYQFFCKTTFNEALAFNIIDLRKPESTSRTSLKFHLSPLHEEQPTIKLPKYKNPL
jgi:hypothetical protein